MKLLIRMPNWLGDFVMATAVFSDLKKSFADVVITTMGKKENIVLLEKDPRVDGTLVIPSGISRFQRMKYVIGQLKKGSFDAVILLTNSFSSAWECFYAKTPQRIGYSTVTRRWLLTDPVTLHRMHQVEKYQRLLTPLGVSDWSGTPMLYLTEADKNEATKLLKANGYDPLSALIGIHPGASYGSAKCWLPERFTALAETLMREGYQVVFVGDTKSASLVNAICRTLPKRVINLAGKTSTRTLASVIRVCQVFVTNDSGPLHMADALGVRVVALFGSTDDELTGPYRQKQGVIHQHVSCSPCFHRKCPLDMACMKNIQIDDVLQKIAYVSNS